MTESLLLFGGRLQVTGSVTVLTVRLYCHDEVMIHCSSIHTPLFLIVHGVLDCTSSALLIALDCTSSAWLITLVLYPLVFL